MNQRKDASLLGLYRVQDLSDEKGVLCGKVLADLGADVIKVEPLGGDHIRHTHSILAAPRLLRIPWWAVEDLNL